MDCIFILAYCIIALRLHDRMDPDQEDAVTVLRALNVLSFNPLIQVFCQILEPENKVHVVACGVPRDHILCVDETKLGLIGKAVVCPGATTIVTNLVTSFSPRTLSFVSHMADEAGGAGGADGDGGGAGGSGDKRRIPGDWMTEYCWGLTQARRSSAEHLIATKAPRCAATAWIPHCRSVLRHNPTTGTTPRGRSR